ncbi:MAG: energy transducer TonB [Terriglobales bacterium]
MESPGKNLLRLLVERDPASPEFRNEVRAVLQSGAADLSGNHEFDMWSDVFVQRPLPWGRFLQSAVLHATAVVLIWAVSIAWLRQQRILDHPVFDRSSLVTFTPQEYLPPLDTGAPQAPKPQKGDPVYAKQPILSVPPEADNRSQTIVVPPDLKLNHDVPLPNIVATGAVVPAVPLDATGARSRIVAPETEVVAPSPDVQFARDRVVQSGLKSDIIAPPPQVTAHQTRGLASPETAVVEPPPQLTQSSKGHVGLMNIGPSEVVAPAPQLTLAEQHALAGRGSGRGSLAGGGAQPVGPPPSMAASGNGRAGGRLIALGIHPVAPTGPVAVPAGNRRGSFAASPKGKAGAAGTPDVIGSKLGAKGSGLNKGSVPAGLHVGAPSSDVEMASVSNAGTVPGGRSGARAASLVAEDKINETERKVFAGRRVYGRTLNMPNLNSSTGSWVIKFAELDGGRKDGELLEPVATQKSDPGYPLELMRANVHGTVTLYAVIHADGKVSDIRVLNSPDDRLDAFATSALARWKFVPAERAGKPVALEAVVEIPFRARSSF